MDELLELLKEIRPEVDFIANQQLIDNGTLDSFDIITLVGELSEHYDIEIGVENLLPKNFNSAMAILGLIQRLQDER